MSIVCDNDINNNEITDKGNNDSQLIFKIHPLKLYKKYTHINITRPSNVSGDLFSCLKEYNFDYKIVNQLIFSLNDNVIRNLYRYIWVKFKLLKIHIIGNLIEYNDDPTYKYINDFQMIYYKDFEIEHNKKLFQNYNNFVYNNLYSTNKTLCIFLYNTIAQYLVY